MTAISNSSNKKVKEIKQFKENKQLKNSLTHCSFVDLNDVTLALLKKPTQYKLGSCPNLFSGWQGLDFPHSELLYFISMLSEYRDIKNQYRYPMNEQ